MLVAALLLSFLDSACLGWQWPASSTDLSPCSSTFLSLRCCSPKRIYPSPQMQLWPCARRLDDEGRSNRCSQPGSISPLTSPPICRPRRPSDVLGVPRRRTEYGTGPRQTLADAFNNAKRAIYRPSPRTESWWHSAILEFASAFADAAIAIPDGTPIARGLDASRGQYAACNTLPVRDLMREVFVHREFAQYKHFFYGGDAGVAEELALTFPRNAHPGHESSAPLPHPIARSQRQRSTL